MSEPIVWTETVAVGWETRQESKSIEEIREIFGPHPCLVNALLDRLEKAEADLTDLRDDVCMVANGKPLDADEDTDKNLLALVARCEQAEAERESLKADLVAARAALDAAHRDRLRWRSIANHIITDPGA